MRKHSVEVDNLREISNKDVNYKFEDFDELELVDTTGEGDAFLGGFAVGCVQNLDDSDMTPVEH